MRVILASGSPRRRELLAAAGVAFEVMISPAEEIHDAAIPLAELCERNAELKAVAVAAVQQGAVVIGADTLVWIEGEPLGKPRDLAEAREMLRKLGGRSHTVCTGVCVIFPDGRSECFHELTEVCFRPLDDETITAYFEKTDPLDKAGAYGIQDSGEMIVKGIDGAFDNVMGLPVARVLRAISSK
jgi:septum formation protein